MCSPWRQATSRNSPWCISRIARSGSAKVDIAGLLFHAHDKLRFAMQSWCMLAKPTRSVTPSRAFRAGATIGLAGSFLVRVHNIARDLLLPRGMLPALWGSMRDCAGVCMRVPPWRTLSGSMGFGVLSGGVRREARLHPRLFLISPPGWDAGAWGGERVAPARAMRSAAFLDAGGQVEMSCGCGGGAGARLWSSSWLRSLFDAARSS